jgi:hypothetical protein
MLLHILILFRTRSLASTQKRMDTNREDNTKCANLNLSPYLSVSAVCSKPSILSQNIRSYSCNFSKLKDLLLEYPGALVVGLQEVWNTQHARIMPGFQPLISRARTAKGGGGIGFLIRTGVPFQVNNTLFLEGQFESLTITLTICNKPYVITNIYKPPGSNIETFLSFAKTLMFPKNHCRVVLSNFNIDMAKPENCDVLTHFASLGMGHTIDQPTLICEKSATLIDNIFTSDRCMSGFILQTDITDHMTLGICPKIGVKNETHKLSEKTYSTPL